MKKYAIVCGSRTGSSFLCDMLSSTNRAGKPQEFFNPWLKEKLCKEYKLEYSDRIKYKNEIIKHYSTSNDVFGIKVVGFWQLSEMIKSELQSDWQYVYLYREDTLLQGISAFIADKGNTWHRNIKTTDCIPAYDKEAIKWYYEDAINTNEIIEDFLELQGKDFLSISYEKDLCEAPEQTVTAILHYLQISTEELPLSISNRYQKPQEPNLTWKKKFLEQNQDIS